MPKLNLRSTAVKRIMQEAAELAAADVDDDGFVAAPLEVRPHFARMTYRICAIPRIVGLTNMPG